MGIFGSSRKRKTARRTVRYGRCDKRSQEDCQSNINCMWTNGKSKKNHCRRKWLRSRR